MISPMFGEEQAVSKSLLSSFSVAPDRFPDSPESGERLNVFQVKQSVKLDGIDANSSVVKLWVSIPRDSKNQRLLTLNVDSSPANWKIVQDKQNRGDFLFVQVENPDSESIEVVVSFSLTRAPEFTAIDVKAVGELTPALKALLAEHLVKDAPHMEVTAEFQKVADEVCGAETNIAIQAQALLQHVAATVDHYSYSKDPKMPTCGIGDSKICINQGGGCCTDVNSYFISLARAREIPARLNMGYRLQEKNLNKSVDPGYRCWVEYYVPNYGWISADIVEADTPTGIGSERWMTGLTSRRLFLNMGREYDFGSEVSSGKINHMSIGYAEVDGVPVRLLPLGPLQPQLTRTVFYTESETE
jgi:transglutaminase-like putative cysteine protease